MSFYKLSRIYLLVRSDAQMTAHRLLPRLPPQSLPQNETASASGSSRVEGRERSGGGDGGCVKGFSHHCENRRFYNGGRRRRRPSSAKCTRLAISGLHCPRQCSANFCSLLAPQQVSSLLRHPNPSTLYILIGSHLSLRSTVKKTPFAVFLPGLAFGVKCE